MRENGHKDVPYESKDVLQGVLAYVFVRPMLAAIQLMCMLVDGPPKPQGSGPDTWGEGKFTFHKWWLWCMLINNVTQVRPRVESDTALVAACHTLYCFCCALRMMSELPSRLM